MNPLNKLMLGALMAGLGIPAPAGVVNMPIAAGYNLVANPIGGLPVDAAISSPVAGTVFYQWAGGWAGNSWDLFGDSTWDNPSSLWKPGEGVFIFSPHAFTLVMSSSGHVPVLPLTLTPGVPHWVGAQYFGMSTFETITGYAASGCTGLTLYRYNLSGTSVPGLPGLPGSYASYTHSGTGWSPSTPVMNPGEGVLIIATSYGALAGSTLGAAVPDKLVGCAASTLLLGTGFLPGSSVRLIRSAHAPVPASTVTVLGATAMQVAFDVDAAAAGPWDVEITPPSGPVTVLPAGVTVQPMSLSGVDPVSGGDCGPVTIQVSGQGFCSSSTVELTRMGHLPISPLSVSVSSDGTLLTAVMDLTARAMGAWDVEVRNPSITRTLPGTFLIQNVALSSISPPRAGACGPLSITLTGMNFCAGTTLDLQPTSGPSIPGTGIVVSPDGRTLQATVALGSAAPGAYDVVVNNSGGTPSTLPGAFVVQAPALASVTPGMVADFGLANVTVSGAGLCPLMTVLARQSGLSLVGTVVSVSPDSTSAVLSFGFAGASGVWDLEMTDGTWTGTLPSALTVAPLALTHVSPVRIGSCDPFTLTLGGSGLSGISSVSLRRTGHSDIHSATAFPDPSGSWLTVAINPAGAASGLWDLILNEAGGGTLTFPGAFQIDPWSISGVFPNFGHACGSQTVQVRGRCFVPGASANLTLGATTLPVTVVSVSSGGGALTASLPLGIAPPGDWDLTITHPDGSTVTFPKAFHVLPCSSSVVSVTMPGHVLVGAGRSRRYSASFQNTGSSTVTGVPVDILNIPADATASTVSLAPPSTLSSPGGSLPQSISFTIPSLLPGQTVTFHFDMTVPTPRPIFNLEARITGPLANSTMQSVEVIGSYDPNDKTGIPGAGVTHAILGSEHLLFDIHFENLPSATAPAQEVRIVDHLDPAHFDLSTFELGKIGFGSQVFIPPPGSKTYSSAALFDVDGSPATIADIILVKIDASLEINPASPNYGDLVWTYRSIDPSTGMLPSNPLLGFLPPNLTPPAGDGFVKFSVDLLPGLASGTDVGSGASIVFDLNPPIATPIWIHRIDHTAPSSSVNPLPPSQPTPSFTVSWAGVDAETSIQSYTVYVSDNAGPYVPVLGPTSATSMIFSGMAGHSYEFHTVAEDIVGNVELVPMTPDTFTYVHAAGCPALDIDLVPGGVLVHWDASATGCHVETTTSLIAPWSPVAAVPAIHKPGRQGVILPVSGPGQYFRLIP